MKNIFKALLNRRDGTKISQYLIVISAGLLNFTAGTHYGWAIPSLERLMSEEHAYKITGDEASTIIILSPLGHVVGAFICCALADTIGRKWTILITSVPQILAFLAIYFSYYSKVLLYIARILAGLGDGGAVTVVPLYIGEISDPAIRGKLGTIYVCLYITGCLFVNVLGSHLDIYNTALICLTFPCLLWLVFPNMPESPYFLFMKEKNQAAEECLKVLNRKEMVKQEAKSLKAAVKRQMSERGKFVDLFVNSVNFKAFMIVALARLVQQLCGYTAILNYYQVLLKTTTHISPMLGSSLLMIVQVVMIFSSSFFIDRLGRKILIICSAALVATCLLILGLYILLKDSSYRSWFPLIVLLVYVLSSCSGLGFIPSVLTSEMFSASIKTECAAMLSIVYAGSIIATTKFYQVTADRFNLAVPFLTFSILTYLGCLCIIFLLIETKGKTLETIQLELKGTREQR